MESEKIKESQNNPDQKEFDGGIIISNVKLYHKALVTKQRGIYHAMEDSDVSQHNYSHLIFDNNSKK